MEKTGISKVKNVWEAHNTIRDPVKKELYLDIIDQVASLFSAGSYYYYIFNFGTMQMEHVDKKTFDVLGIEAKDFKLDTVLNIMHPEDLECMHEKESAAVEFLFQKIPTEDIPHYKVVYLMRLKHADGSYKTILHQSKTLTMSGDGKIQQVIGIHTDVSYLNLPYDKKVSFLSTERPSYFTLSSHDDIQLVENSCKELFSLREKEILKMIAEGKDFKVIAQELHLSPHTINTHKRNMLKKSQCNNTMELVAKCIREGVV